MAIKNENLTGTEVCVTGLNGSNTAIRNDSADVIYASTFSGIIPGTSGVLSIPAGDSAVLFGSCGKAFLLGNGLVTLIGTDYSTNPFKTSTVSSGSAVDEVARAAATTHAGNKTIHITADERTRWNAVNYVNPNLLMNPDFTVDQRGKGSYSQSGYGYDCWCLGRNTGTVKAENNKCTITCTDISDTQHIIQFIEGSYAGKNLVFSLNIEAIENCKAIIRIADDKYATIGSHMITAVPGKMICSATVPDSFKGMLRVLISFFEMNTVGSYFTFSEPKLETGTVATKYAATNETLETLKCQRYYQLHTTGDIPEIELTPPMRKTPKVNKLSIGKYEYSAEI